MLLWILGYLAVAAAVVLWDAYIGFGFEFPDIEDGPNAILAGIFWPIGLPIILMIVISNALSGAKERRLERQEITKRRKRREAEQERKLRIQEEQEYEETLAEVEKEIHR